MCRFVRVNNVWDKITKVLIALNDAALNWYFIVQVKKRLVANGLQKYNALARFNTQIILISVGMDVRTTDDFFGSRLLTASPAAHHRHHVLGERSRLHAVPPGRVHR